MAVISVKSLALFVQIGFSLAAVSDQSCTFDADCSSFIDEFCCNNECVKRTSGCCSKDLHCFRSESCCNHKCKLDCGDNGNTVMIVLGVVGGIIFVIFVAFWFRYYRKRRLRYILIMEENGEITVRSTQTTRDNHRPTNKVTHQHLLHIPHLPTQLQRKDQGGRALVNLPMALYRKQDPCEL